MIQTLSSSRVRAPAQAQKHDRSLRVAIALMILSPLLLISVLGGIVWHVATKLWAARDAAQAYVLHDPEAIADFGGELKPLDANFSGNLSGGKSTISFDVVGPAGSAKVTVVSHRYNDAWQVDTARYVRAGVLHDISPRP